MTVRWLEPALDDVKRLYDFLLDKDPAAGRVARAIRSGADRLLDSPEIGRPLADGTSRRELVIPFGAGAYVLRYRIHDPYGRCDTRLARPRSPVELEP